ncbi:MAG: PAS domain S-box protein [Nostoc sp.]|uniref:hybrid sensor histidine kinase/response regulator n=1 Tax=Nostoc sp. TaxID=1180 RepID=UPI002FF47B90
MRAEEQKGVAESLFVGDGEISVFLRSHDWSQTPLGDIETWSDSFKTAVQILLTELEQVKGENKTQIESLQPPQDCTQTAALCQSAEAERKQVEATLLKSEKQSRDILESITDAFFALDENWQFTYVNQTAYALVARTPGDLIGKSFWEEFPGVNDSEFEQMHRRVMQDRVAQSLTAFYPDHDRWYEVHTYPAANGVTIYFRNVTTQIQAKTALRQSEEKSRNILESIAEAFFALDQDWRFSYTNQSAEALLDRPPGDLIGKNLWEEYPGLTGNELETIYRSAMRDRVSGKLTAFYPDHDRWYEVRTYPAANGIAVYFNNVTAQIQAEESSRLSEARFRRIFESKMIGMGIWNRSGEIIDANDALLNLIGYARQDLESGLLSWQELTPPEQHCLDEQALAEIAKSGTCSSYEKEFIHKQGQRVPILVGAARFADTTETGVFFTIDLTERKAAQAQRENLLQQEQAARAAAEEANRVKDEFLAVLSHELRSPLNPILGWTRLLQNGKLDPARQIEALTTIERNAKLQSQLIEDLLDISRIMQGKLTLTKAPVSLAFVIYAAAETVSLAAQARNIQITLNLGPEIIPIFGDAARLQQVVWNLLTNAVKFTANGGQVTVELRQVESQVGKVCNQMAQIQVIDTGKGISPQFLPFVFEYFRQQDGSTTRTFGGLGLGLAIVKQIVELHGGTVKAESQGEEQGATFIVQLPLFQQAIPLVSEPIYTQADSETSLKTIQVLLVDDDTDTREFQTFLLEQNGAKVIPTASGLEALQVLEQLIPDVIVSDIGMPQMDGYMLMQQIRSRLPTRGGTIPAIALTAYAAEIDKERTIEAGFQMHLTKPLEPEQFVSAIVSLLKLNRV